jgi:hypothetical protein
VCVAPVASRRADSIRGVDLDSLMPAIQLLLVGVAVYGLRALRRGLSQGLGFDCGQGWASGAGGAQRLAPNQRFKAIS